MFIAMPVVAFIRKGAATAAQQQQLSHTTYHGMDVLEYLISIVGLAIDNGLGFASADSLGKHSEDKLTYLNIRNLPEVVK